jgi:hypothetical protein
MGVLRGKRRRVPRPQPSSTITLNIVRAGGGIMIRYSVSPPGQTCIRHKKAQILIREHEPNLGAGCMGVAFAALLLDGPAVIRRLICGPPRDLKTPDPVVPGT